MLPSVGTAVALELGVLVAAAEDWRAAAALFATAAAVLAWLLNRTVLWPPRCRGRRTGLRLAAATALALIFAAGALTPYLQRGYEGGSFAAYLKALLVGGGRASAEGAEQAAAGRCPEEIVEALFDLGDVYPAVILRPQVKPYAVLVSPLMAAGGALFAGQPARPLGIPFSGYYTFQRASVLPPRKYHAIRGDPAERRFRTTDGSALVMKAHQDFGEPIDLDCCRAIALEMRIEETPPGARVSLYLGDTRAPEQPELMLGPERLQASTRFRVPRERALREFNRATVRFWARPFHQSVRVAVERLLLIR